MKKLKAVILVLLIDMKITYGGFSEFCSMCTPYMKDVNGLNFNFDDDKYFQAETYSGKNNFAKAYDFIIVGSGSAGSVIASRLSEIKEWEILLLEVGKGENLVSRIPAAAPIMQLSHYNWDYRMEKQSNFARGMDDGLLAYPRGRALGGSSVINYMIYTRGNPRDFDRWAQQGNPGWSYKDVLPYFLKSEKTSLKHRNPRFHNSKGLWSTENNYMSLTTKSWLRSSYEMNTTVVDYTSAYQMGFGPVQANILHGTRHSVARAFLHPFRYRKNLHMFTSALVTKILIDPISMKAYGVEMVYKGVRRIILARKEVIISAGALISPQLLMLAGIGPKKHLAKFQIPLLKDLQVGQNMHDHVTYVGLTFLMDQDYGNSLLKWLDPANMARYLLNGTGPHTSLGGVSGIGYIKTSVDTDPDPNFPDMELIFVDAALCADFGLTAKTMNIRDEVYKKYWGPISLRPSWTIFPMLLHPRSIGHIELRSTSIKDPPKFFGNYYSDPTKHDQRTMLAAIRYIERLAQTTPMKQLGSRLYRKPVPGCEYYQFDSDEYWFCALETLSITLHHQVGTCKMGPKSDPTAVVDHELKVHGIKALRVADTSIIPFAITAHTNAPAVMIGEKAADLIKSEWGRK